jgi:hypothetical protein
MSTFGITVLGIFFVACGVVGYCCLVISGRLSDAEESNRDRK